MSCHGCAAKFSLLTKEHGCPNCGFAYCGSCLKKKIVVPKLGTSKQKVCISCFNGLESLKAGKPISDRHETSCISRLESLENPARPPITVYRQNPKMAQLKKGLSLEDQEIVDRLEKLKQDRKKSMPSEEDMKLRLARLKEIDPESMARAEKPVYNLPDSRTSVKKEADLLTQLKEEADLDAKLPKVEDEIAARLAKLRGQDPSSPTKTANPEQNDLNKGVHSSQSEDDSRSLDEVNKVLEEIAEEANMEAVKAIAGLEMDKELQKRLYEMKMERKKKETEGRVQSDDSDEDNTHATVVEKALAELDIDKSLEESGASKGSKKNTKKKKAAAPSRVERDDSDNEESEDELPWCVICNKDANLRCKGCDGDLYCKRCFTEGHDVLDMTDHKTEAFKAPRL